MHEAGKSDVLNILYRTIPSHTMSQAIPYCVIVFIVYSKTFMIDSTVQSRVEDNVAIILLLASTLSV